MNTYNPKLSFSPSPTFLPYQKNLNIIMKNLLQTLTSKPLSPPPPPKSNLPMLYYGLVVVGTAAIILALYNLIIIRWCTRHRPPRSLAGPASSRSFDGRNITSVSSFKYKKESEENDQANTGYECAVCLSVFEDGEEVRKLPRCKHSFHAPCIDMWLYSHFDCPLCRAPVGPPVLRRPLEIASPAEHSREGLLAAVATSV